jgi:hypothetical protein
MCGSWRSPRAIRPSWSTRNAAESGPERRRHQQNPELGCRSFSLSRRGGGMGARIRAFAWSETQIGSATAWPPALRTVIRLMLSNRLPIMLRWGPQYFCIDNDSDCPVLGKKHPRANVGQKRHPGGPHRLGPGRRPPPFARSRVQRAHGQADRTLGPRKTARRFARGDWVIRDLLSWLNRHWRLSTRGRHEPASRHSRRASLLRGSNLHSAPFRFG